MLRHLRVTNFAILSDVAIELGPGMNVLTGETGAGKSLIVEAVNLLRGGRASADIPRAGADEAVVEAIVEVPADLRARVASLLDGAGLPLASSDRSIARGTSGRASEVEHVDELFIRRVIQRGGRSRTYVNGALTTAARLAELGALLIDLSGQHQHQGLVDPSKHLEILDAFARRCAIEAAGSSGARPKPSTAGSADGPSITANANPLVEAMTEAWAELRRCDEELAALGGDEREREARLDYLRYQLDELDAAALEPGEDIAIELERTRLASFDQLQKMVRTAEDLLYGSDDSARDRVAGAAREIERALRVDPSLDEVHRRCTEIEALIDDAADDLRGYADKLEGDPERLAYLDERVALIRRLVRKHATPTGYVHEGQGLASAATAPARGPAPVTQPAGATARASALDLVIAKTAELRAELDALTSRDDLLAELASRRTRAEAAALAAATALTQSRTTAARKLEKDVAVSLGELGMGSARLTVLVEPRALGPTGADHAELVLASNKGEDARPLAKVASGGELSRIMLALKLALRRADEVATYVFDEVDTGIGGATAQVVGTQIRAVASTDSGRQVLCVTHLPQIAAFADHHFQVEKTEIAGRTETHVRKLNAAARKDELARMLGGHATSKARAHAAELLAEAARIASIRPAAESPDDARPSPTTTRKHGRSRPATARA